MSAKPIVCTALPFSLLWGCGFKAGRRNFCDALVLGHNCSQKIRKGGGWKYHIKCCCTSLFSMLQAYRCLTVIASWHAYEATTVGWHLYMCCIARKEINQSCPMYLLWHFQPLPYNKVDFATKCVSRKIHFYSCDSYRWSNQRSCTDSETEGEGEAGARDREALLGREEKNARWARITK